MDIKEVKLTEISKLSLLCAAIYHANYAAHWLNNDPSEYIQEQYSESSLLKQLEDNSKYYFAITKGNLIGFMKLNFDRVSVLDKDTKALEIEKIYFEIDSQRQGFGSQLLDFVIKLADKDNYTELHLDVLTSNVKGRNFYFKHGFKDYSDTLLSHPLFKPELRAMKVMLKTLKNR